MYLGVGLFYTGGWSDESKSWGVWGHTLSMTRWASFPQSRFSANIDVFNEAILCACLATYTKRSHQAIKSSYLTS